MNDGWMHVFTTATTVQYLFVYLFVYLHNQLQMSVTLNWHIFQIWVRYASVAWYNEIVKFIIRYCSELNSWEYPLMILLFRLMGDTLTCNSILEELDLPRNTRQKVAISDLRVFCFLSSVKFNVFPLSFYTIINKNDKW